MPSQVTQWIGYVTLPWNYIYVVFWVNDKIYTWTNNFLSNKILTATCTVLVLAHKFKNWERYRQVWVSKKHMTARKCHHVCTLNTAAHVQAAAFSLPQLGLSGSFCLLGVQFCCSSYRLGQFWGGNPGRAGPSSDWSFSNSEHIPMWVPLLFCVSKINSWLVNKHICLFMIFLFRNVFYYFTNIVKRCNILFWM